MLLFIIFFLILYAILPLVQCISPLLLLVCFSWCIYVYNNYMYTTWLINLSY